VSARRYVGRPRRVTDADVTEILAWHAARETRRELSQRLGLSVRVISRVIQSGGLHYKTAGPQADVSQEVSLSPLGQAGESVEFRETE
jgi:hypothetical protein